MEVFLPVPLLDACRAPGSERRICFLICGDLLKPICQGDLKRGAIEQPPVGFGPGPQRKSPPFTSIVDDHNLGSVRAPSRLDVS